MTETIHRDIHTIRRPSDQDRKLLHVKGGTLHKMLRYRGRTHDFYYGSDNNTQWITNKQLTKSIADLDLPEVIEWAKEIGIR